MIENSSEKHAYILLKSMSKNKKVNELIQMLKKHEDYVDSYSIDNSLNIYLQFKNIQSVDALLERHKEFANQNKI